MLVVEDPATQNHNPVYDRWCGRDIVVTTFYIAHPLLEIDCTGLTKSGAEEACPAVHGHQSGVGGAENDAFRAWGGVGGSLEKGDSSACWSRRGINLGIELPAAGTGIGIERQYYAIGRAQIQSIVDHQRCRFKAHALGGTRVIHPRLLQIADIGGRELRQPRKTCSGEILAVVAPFACFTAGWRTGCRWIVRSGKSLGERNGPDGQERHCRQPDPKDRAQRGKADPVTQHDRCEEASLQAPHVQTTLPNGPNRSESEQAEVGCHRPSIAPGKD